MASKHTVIYSFVFSLTVHVVVLGAFGGLWDVSLKSDVPETNLVELERTIPASLPEIKVLGEVQKLVADQKPEESDLQAQDIQEVSESIDSKNEAQEAMLRYQDMIKQKIESCRKYPSWAQRRKMQGSTCLEFTVLSDGTCKNTRVVASSGHKSLDKEAVENICRASPFLPIPAQVYQDSVTIRVVIMFVLS
ncbi:MAG: energy transducer TonB [PVC group bacterium]|nr:energy transducer TonB [PVC group bacterium]